MGWWRWLQRRFEVVFRKDETDHALDEEMQFHVEMEIRQNVESGMDPVEARRRALVAFGGVERFKEEVRDARGGRLIDDVIQDSRVALRSLPRQPVFLVVVLATLGIGIGGSVAMFGVIERSVLQSLPYPDADELVLGRVTWEGNVGFTVSGPDLFDVRDEAGSFEALGAITPFPVTATITGGREAERIVAPYASVGFFETFAMAPVVGRYFAADEGEADGAAVVVLSHAYWQGRYGGDASVLGEAISVDGVPSTVVGVAPAGFRFFMDVDLWRPIQRSAGWATSRQFHDFVIVARLAANTDVRAAQAEVDAISLRLGETYPDTNRDKGLNITPLKDALTEGYRPTLNILLAAVLVLLLIACANVAGLLLARGSARRAEMAVRSAMGAGRRRLFQQLLTENVYLAVGAGLVGLGLAVWTQKGILAFMPMDMLGPMEADLSMGTLAFALGLSGATMLLFGALPSLYLSKVGPAGDLRAAGRGSGSSGSRFRSGLVVAQVAMTAVLLTVSGLLYRSFQELTQVEAGFDSERLLTAQVALPAGYDPAARVVFYSDLRSSVQAIPGVTSVALTSHLPVQDPGGNYRVARPEEFGSDGVFGTLAYRRGVLPGYFSALEIPMARGRDLRRSDDADAPAVVIISESLGTHLFGADNPLGRTIAVDQGGDEPDRREVVGVVGDVLIGGPAYGRDFAMYFPYDQLAVSTMRLAIRVQGDLAGVVTAVRAALLALDPDVPLSDVSTMEEAISLSLTGNKSIATVLILFAAVALLLAGVGLYGVLAYRVSRRFHEIGVRMALGASVPEISREIVVGGLRLVGLGLVVGLPGAYLAGRFLQGMLFEVGAADPLTFASVAGFLSAVAVVACLLPARRAAAVDPVVAFRAD